MQVTFTGCFCLRRFLQVKPEHGWQHRSRASPSSLLRPTASQSNTVQVTWGSGHGTLPLDSRAFLLHWPWKAGGVKLVSLLFRVWLHSEVTKTLHLSGVQVANRGYLTRELLSNGVLSYEATTSKYVTIYTPYSMIPKRTSKWEN